MAKAAAYCSGEQGGRVAVAGGVASAERASQWPRWRIGEVWKLRCQDGGLYGAVVVSGIANRRRFLG